MEGEEKVDNIGPALCRQGICVSSGGVGVGVGAVGDVPGVGASAGAAQRELRCGHLVQGKCITCRQQL
jgi:hypothetical protein